MEDMTAEEFADFGKALEKGITEAQQTIARAVCACLDSLAKQIDSLHKEEQWKGV